MGARGGLGRTMAQMAQNEVTAVLWDFGGVILSSPFEAFNRYETERGLPLDFIRSINATNPHSNAWALLERSEVTPRDFDALFAAESEAHGHRIPGADVLALLSGDVRPNMVRALDAVIAHGFKTACLTNNVTATDIDPDRSISVREIMNKFHVVVESSKVGVRKPEPRFYEIACELLEVEPNDCVFLDDLGINLKPAAAMGMRTIKVVQPDDALRQLSEIVGVNLSAA